MFTRRGVRGKASWQTITTKLCSHVVELRSDTFTTPNTAMRKAMADAKVGDDVHKEDPTVNELERQAANLLGKEAALFVPSGTMGNLIAVMVHCERRGMEVLLGDLCHIFLNEQGGVSQLGGIHSRPITTKPDGTFDLNEIRDKIRPVSANYPTTGLICVENTHLKTGGQPLPLEYLEQLGALKADVKLPLYMDGARIMNAAVYHRVSPSKIAHHFDSGLGSPVGSVLVGSAQFISKAIRVRKVLGGGMRQAGFLAAAGLYSLTKMIDRLEDDHKHAKQIGTAVSDVKSKLIFTSPTTKTNIVFLKMNTDFLTAREFSNRLKQVMPDEEKTLGKSIVVKAGVMDKSTVRLVTHVNVNQNDVMLAIEKLRYVIQEIDAKL